MRLAAQEKEQLMMLGCVLLLSKYKIVCKQVVEQNGSKTGTKAITFLWGPNLLMTKIHFVSIKKGQNCPCYILPSLMKLSCKTQFMKF